MKKISPQAPPTSTDPRDINPSRDQQRTTTMPRSLSIHVTPPHQQAPWDLAEDDAPGSSANDFAADAKETIQILAISPESSRRTLAPSGVSSLPLCSRALASLSNPRPPRSLVLVRPLSLLSPTGAGVTAVPLPPWPACASFSLDVIPKPRGGWPVGLSDRRMNWVENGIRSEPACYRGNAIQKLNSVCTGGAKCALRPKFPSLSKRCVNT